MSTVCVCVCAHSPSAFVVHPSLTPVCPRRANRTANVSSGKGWMSLPGRAVRPSDNGDPGLRSGVNANFFFANIP